MKGQVGLITITRPEALNALNRAVLRELNEFLDAVNLETTRCLIITGAG
jgi:enoyl-CoA hydratase